MNMEARAGDKVDRELALTPKAHGQQVWDRIAASELYGIGDQIL